jgi:RHS repeat-associated protein
VTVLDLGWSTLAGSTFGWVYLHQGGRFDATSGLYHFRHRDYSPTLGLWTSLDPIRYDAGDVNLYRVVFNTPTIYTDPSGLQGTAGAMSPESHRKLAKMFERYNEAVRQERARIQRNVAAFREACKTNNIDPKIGESILDACLNTSKPWSINPCKKWAEKVDAKLPARDGRDIVKGTERPGPGGKGTTGLQISQWAWTYTPCPNNLWCIFVDGHFGIRVKFPDGQIFYFDDGNWGTVFTPADNKIPPHAR